MKPVLTLLFAATLALNGCSDGETVTATDFVGKWASSKLTTPVHLYGSGEWEIKSEDGAILQYGVWQYKNEKIIWSYKVDSHIGHDLNAVLSITPREFKVRENDRTITTFTRLD